MKRIVLLSLMAVCCLSASSQSLYDKVAAEVERQRPKHSQQGNTVNAQAAAAVAAQQAAVSAQASAAVSESQRQAQHIDQQYSVEKLAEQKSVRPKVPAGPHTATSYSQKHKQGISFGKGANKPNKIISIEDVEDKTDKTKQGQWGTIGGPGNSYTSTYKNAKQFRVAAQQTEQQRQPRVPAKKSDTVIQQQIIAGNPSQPIYNMPDKNNLPTKAPAPQKAPEQKGKESKLPTETLPKPGIMVDTSDIHIKLDNNNNHPVEEIPTVREGTRGGTLATNLAIMRHNNKQIQNGLKDGWSSKNTAWQGTYIAEPTGKGCSVIRNGRCIKK